MEMMWRSYIRFRFLGKRKQWAAEISREKEELHQEHRRFCRMAYRVEEACALWSSEKPEALAGRYMAHVLSHQKRPAWWAEQGEFLDQPWFIYRYCREHGLIVISQEPPPPLPLRLIRPEKANGQWIMLKADRNVFAPEQGSVILQCSYQKELHTLLRSMGFSQTSGGYVLQVDECKAPLADRAAESAQKLLQAGYGVTVEEAALEKMIRRGNILPAHGYWVKETNRPEYLRLIYPYDPRLHRYLCILGAKWEQKQMLLPIVCVDRIADVVRLYDFRITKEAQRRMDLWDALQQEAGIYRPRRFKQTSPAEPLDRFREMLKQPVQVLPDLEDKDE